MPFVVGVNCLLWPAGERPLKDRHDIKLLKTVNDVNPGVVLNLNSAQVVQFPASRGPGAEVFSFAFAGLTNLCHESKFTVLSMRGGCLVTESPRDSFMFFGLTLQQRIYC